MSKPSDAWYVRFPDGRVLRASSTEALRNHLAAGRIPYDSWVRRSREDEWVTLDWCQEFNDLVPPPRTNSSPSTRQPRPGLAAGQPSRQGGGVASRLDPTQLQTVGVRGLVDELLAAMDNTLVRNKLLVACVTGVLGGVLVALAETLQGTPGLPWSWLSWPVAGLVFLVLGAVCDGLLTQMTHVELSNLRPARWTEAASGLVRLSLRLGLAFLLTAGVAVLAIVLLRLLPSWAAGLRGPAWWTGLCQYGSAVVGMVLEILLWPVVGFSLLLGPIVVIEECSVATALGHWGRLLRQHLGRAFLYEGLAAALGAIFTLPFALPLVLAFTGRMGLALPPGVVMGDSLDILSGLVATPLIAYLVVANVFIYLNLRYEVGPGHDGMTG
jgi:hypothetical protein